MDYELKVVMVRKYDLKKIGNNAKQIFNHGIRLKDGIGSQAYFCLSCNSTFSSLKKS
jgi:transposase-like protein